MVSIPVWSVSQHGQYGQYGQYPSMVGIPTLTQNQGFLFGIYIGGVSPLSIDEGEEHCYGRILQAGDIYKHFN